MTETKCRVRSMRRPADLIQNGQHLLECVQGFIIGMLMVPGQGLTRMYIRDAIDFYASHSASIDALKLCMMRSSGWAWAKQH